MSEVADGRSAPLAARRVTSALLAIGGLCLLLALAARTTGAGWLIVLMCLLAGGFLVGVIWPHLALIGVRVDAQAPADTTSGTETPITVRLNRTGMGVLARTPGGEWTGITRADDSVIVHTPAHRGIVDHITLELACGAPFGISWRRRRITARLRHATCVAPRIAEWDGPLPSGRGAGGETPRSAPRMGDQLRSVRDYLAGDPMRLVHWPASARMGELIVKELEAPARRHLHVVVVLIDHVEPDESATASAMGLIARGLGSDYAVSLSTIGPTGPETRPITRMLDAGRQLARARAGSPHAPDADEGEIVRIAAAAA